MEKDFFELIKKNIDSGNYLFYNSEGSSIAYKLCVRHISSAPYFNLAFRVGNLIHPNDTLFLVDFDKQIIVETEDPIQVIPLKTY